MKSDQLVFQIGLIVALTIKVLFRSDHYFSVYSVARESLVLCYDLNGSVLGFQRLLLFKIPR